VADLRVVVQESENKDNIAIGRAVLVPPGWNMTYPEGTTTEAHGFHQTNTAEPTSNLTSSTSATISATTTTVVVSTPQPAFLPPLTNGCNSCVGLGVVPLSTYSECVASNPMVTAQIIAKDSGCGMDACGYTVFSGGR